MAVSAAHGLSVAAIRLPQPSPASSCLPQPTASGNPPSHSSPRGSPLLSPAHWDPQVSPHHHQPLGISPIITSPWGSRGVHPVLTSSWGSPLSSLALGTLRGPPSSLVSDIPPPDPSLLPLQTLGDPPILARLGESLGIHPIRVTPGTLSPILGGLCDPCPCHLWSPPPSMPMSLTPPISLVSPQGIDDSSKDK